MLRVGWGGAGRGGVCPNPNPSPNPNPNDGPLLSLPPPVRRACATPTAGGPALLSLPPPVRRACATPTAGGPAPVGLGLRLSLALGLGLGLGSDLTQSDAGTRVQLGPPERIPRMESRGRYRVETFDHGRRSSCPHSTHLTNGSRGVVTGSGLTQGRATDGGASCKLGVAPLTVGSTTAILCAGGCACHARVCPCRCRCRCWLSSIGGQAGVV
jgi:hypothetical protein